MQMFKVQKLLQISEKGSLKLNYYFQGKSRDGTHSRQIIRVIFPDITQKYENHET